jgi:hypothetical protein
MVRAEQIEPLNFVFGFRAYSRDETIHPQSVFIDFLGSGYFGNSK